MSEHRGTKKLAVLMSFSGAGGVEKMMNNLLQEFALRTDLEVELILIRSSGPYMDRIPSGIKVHKLKAGHSFTAVPELARYFKANKPDALLAAKDRAGRAAVRARSLAGVEFPIVVRLGTNLSASLEHRSAISRWLRVAPLRRIYSRIDRVIGNSSGVVRDIQQLAQLSDAKVAVIRNPAVTAEMLEMAEADSPHAWFDDGSCPVIVAMGRLTLQKDFTTLIQAFSEVRAQRAARLIILGEGGERRALEKLVADLHLGADVLLAGHQHNPYVWLSRADLFVLSSRWEGSPNALTEAFALGIPCVSTDCPSGPAEILENGKYGTLVAVGSVNEMSLAISESLNIAKVDINRDSVLNEYRAQVSADRYLQVLFPGELESVAQ